MSYLDYLEEENSRTRTLNGAAAYSATGSACLDLFATAGGMRYRSRRELRAMFDRAYIETPDLAMKLLFYIRDIRGGMGERETFRALIRHTAMRWPESAVKNVRLIAEYGRWDDLLCLLGTPAQDEAVRVIRAQLDKDLEAAAKRSEGDIEAPISLLAKWMPSGNTSSARTRKNAQILMSALGMKSRAYRKMLSFLRSQIALTERYLTNQTQEKICFEAVPAGAMLRYRDAFHRGPENKRFREYIENVSAGKNRIHVDTLFPYEILRPFFNREMLRWGWEYEQDPPAEQSAYVLEALWNSQNPQIAGENAICIVDTSGSMYMRCGCGPLPALISQSLGLYYAERCKGYFHGHLITFESEPHLVKIPDGTVEDKLTYIQSMPWGMSTNLEAVFDLLLDTAVAQNVPQEELPSMIYIISDMEFNMCMTDSDETIFENARKRFEEAGYELPAVVFHNVNSWHMQAPVRGNTKGAALVSGAGTSSFREEYSRNTTPLEHMLKVLEGKRYEPVCA